MKGKLLIIVLFAAVAGGILCCPRPSARPARRRGHHPATPAAPAATTRITVLLGTEKRAFIEARRRPFGKPTRNTASTSPALGSIEAADRILDNQDLPMIFSPGDSLILKMLASDWQTKNGSTLFDAEGDGAPQPLVITPLVFVAWEDRAKVLEKAGAGRITWKGLQKALPRPRAGPAAGGDAEWGFIKLGHTDPDAVELGPAGHLLHGPRAPRRSGRWRWPICSTPSCRPFCATSRPG